MRLLANENFPLDAVEALRADGHDVAWIREDSPQYVAQVAVQALASQTNWAGHFSVVEDNRIRMTPLTQE